jgi:hypothetical protein
MPKLSLRDLFAVVTIAALALGWVLDHWRLTKTLQEWERLRPTLEVLEFELPEES